MKKECIYREDLYDFLQEQAQPITGTYSRGRNDGLNIAKSAVHNRQVTPTADVEPVRHGHWLLKVDSYGPDYYGEYWEEAVFVCPECGRREEVDIDVLFSDKRLEEECAKFPYCHCGVKMDGGVRHDSG